MHVARPATAVAVPAGFAVAAVLDGTGEIAGDDGPVPVSRGDVLAVPHAAGDWTLRGDVEAVVCRPAVQGPS
jgi:mannose-6-phosphate isomerase